MMMFAKKGNLSVLALLGGVLLAASCGGDPVDAGTGGDGDGDAGDGDGDSGDGDGDAGDGDGDAGDGDGDGDTGGMSGDGDGTGGLFDPSSGGASSGGDEGTGGASSGGDEGTGGELDPGTGGDQGTGGALGTGGDQGTVTTATLGDPCGSPGAFACAETNPKLALICGGDNEWEFRETCEEEQFCDSYEGSGLGTCRIPLPECEVVTGAFCDDDDSRVVECAESGFETVVVEECASGYGCVNGNCAEVDDSCPEPSLYTYNCSGDACGGKPGVCVGKTGCDNANFGATLYEGLTATVRVPVDELCSLAECGKPYYQLIVPSSNSPELGVRYRIGPGWGMVPFENGVGDFCGDVVESCIVIPPLLGGSSRGVTLIPLSENPVIRNVTIDLVPAETTCD